MSERFEAMQTDPERFWEDRYRASSGATSGRPGEALRRFAAPLATGRALELGCGKGDDAVWLARQGWFVVAVEISQAALAHAAANAERAKVSDRLSFERHDLRRTFPVGRFDLVTASFLAAFPREPVFQRAAKAVARGGHILIIDHASRTPWSFAPVDWQFPTADEFLATLALPDRDWDRVHVGAIEREANGPNGATAIVRDNVILLRRL